MPVTIRLARDQDVPAIVDFGAALVPEHYTPLIGAEDAQAQVDQWWTPQRLAQAVEHGWLFVAEDGEELVGVAEIGVWEGAPVIWKLYLRADRRGEGIGPRLLQAIIAGLPPDTPALHVEHMAGNEGAARFYEREGFRIVRIDENSENPPRSVVWRELSL